MCQHFASEYNRQGVPKQVHFIEAFVVECFQRHGSPLLACETLLKGKYVKHNNNFGVGSRAQGRPGWNWGRHVPL